MAKFCMKCGQALGDNSKFCPSCGAAIPAAQPAPQPPQQPTPAQPQTQRPQAPAQQPQAQRPQAPAQPQYAPRANAAPQAPAKKKGKGWLVALIVVLVCASIATVCVLGFRDGGFFRKKNGGDGGGKEATIVYDVKTIESLLDYAKKLEEAGSKDAAAAVYELIAKGGGADYIDEAHRDFPLVSAADEVEEYKGLFEKKGGAGK